MLSEEFNRILRENDLTFLSGVPDSTFKAWAYTRSLVAEGLENVIAVNECEAVAVCTGYHLKTGKVGVVYMQNSGLGKAVNPLTSLVQIYKIPMLLVIGWRGEVGTEDAPQHEIMGKITLPLLETLGVPYKILNDLNAKEAIEEAKECAEKNNSTCALIVRKGFFEDEIPSKDFKELMTREEAIRTITKNIEGKIISTTGKTSRELFESSKDNFYMMGSMGCAASIGLGYALDSDKPVYILDGDGAVLMQMGSLATIGHHNPNLVHIVLDNNSYDSTGGQPTVSSAVKLCEVAKNCGYESAVLVKDKKSLEEALKTTEKTPSMIVVKIKKGARKDLGRPDISPEEIKKRFMK